MTRRVRPGDQFNITAAEYNRLLAAADALHKNRLPGGGGPRTHLQNAATVRVHNITNETIPIGGVCGFQSPLTDPLEGPVELARFVRDATIRVGKPGVDGCTGSVGVAIEPIANDKVGRVVFDGVAAALVNVKKTWHEYADASPSPSFILESKPEGSAQILWRRDPTETGVQWAVVRVGHPKDIVYLVKVPPGGITPRRGTITGQAACALFKLDQSGNIEPVLDVDGEQVRIVARNHSTQRIRGPIEGSGDQYLTVTFDGNQSWVLDPPKQTLLCKPTKRIKAKSWGTARELRFDGTQWRPVGVKVAVYNVCEYALLASQQIICHFHEDTASYLTIGCRCCEGSSSSSSSSSESSFSSSSKSSSSDSSSESSSSDSSHSSSTSSRSSSDSSESLGSSESSVSLSVSSVGSSSSSASSSDSSSESNSSYSGSESSGSLSHPSFANSSISESSESTSDSSESESESSHSSSASQSTSASESGSEPSYSRPSFGSESYSQSASDSQSGSDSTSHSTSTSVSGSVSESQSDSTSDSEREPSYSRPSSSSESGSIIGSDSTSHSLSQSGSTSDSLSASDSQSDSDSKSASRSTNDSTSTSRGDRPSDSSEDSSDRPSESLSESSHGSERPSHSISDSEPPSETSSESNKPCYSTWIWSCGWELVESDCEEPGEPPTSSGAFDGQFAEMSA